MKLKKFLCIILILTFALNAFFACDFSESDANETTPSETTQSNPPIPENPSTENLNINAIIYECSEGISLDADTENFDFSTKIYKDDLAEKTLDIDILENEYSFSYDNSCDLAFTDIKAHAYTSQDGKSQILINAETGEFIKYVGIPYEDTLVSENDYINFIQKLIGSNSDLSKYGYYKMYTHLYIRSDNEFRSTTKEGFYSKFNTGESFGSYMFFFTKTIGDTKTEEHITAVFNEKTFSLEVYEFDYDEEKFSGILKDLEEFKKAAENHILKQVHDDYNVIDINISSASLFIKDGKPYIKFSVDVIMSLDGYEEYSFTSLATVICNYAATQNK